jgi:hypothetical protein
LAGIDDASVLQRAIRDVGPDFVKDVSNLSNDIVSAGADAVLQIQKRFEVAFECTHFILIAIIDSVTGLSPGWERRRKVANSKRTGSVQSVLMVCQS